MKRNILSLAVTAAALGVAGTVNAMYVNENGIGEALVFPFYSAENGNDTAFTIVNTTGLTKGVKVRIVEGIDSQEVLDFNLYLSPNDVFSGVITSDPNGDGAIIRTVDTSCTVPVLGNPDLGGTTTDLGNGVMQKDQPFVDFLFGEDDTVQGLERTAEGYIEVFEMAQWELGDGSYGDAAEHQLVAGSPPTPADCGAFVEGWSTNLPGNGDFVDLPLTDTVPWDGGGLFGSGVVINVSEGTAAGYDAVAIEDWYDAGQANAYHRAPGDVAPNFQTSNTLVEFFDDGEVTQLDFAGAGANAQEDGLLASTALFMKLNVSNEYVVDPQINALTDWVITMPTKRDFTRPTGADPEVAAIPPFTNRWDGTGACEPIDFESWDREESPTVTPVGSPIFSPRPPGADPTPDFEICTEVSVLSFGDSSALNASENLRYGLGSILNANEGWARVSFDPALTIANDSHVLEDALGNEITGLPVVGFAVFNYQNGDIGEGIAANYAAAAQHKAVVSIAAAQ